MALKCNFRRRYYFIIAFLCVIRMRQVEEMSRDSTQQASVISGSFLLRNLDSCTRQVDESDCDRILDRRCTYVHFNCIKIHFNRFLKWFSYTYECCLKIQPID